MKDSDVKNKILIIAVILTFGCVVMVVLSSSKVSKTQEELIIERYTRMTAEEKLSQTQTKLNSLEAEMAKKQNQIENVQVLLEKAKVSASELQNQMDKLSQANQQLEEALKSATPELSQTPETPPVGGP